MSTNRAFGNFGKFKEISLKMYVQVLFYFFPGNFLEIVCPGMYPQEKICSFSQRVSCVAAQKTDKSLEQSSNKFAANCLNPRSFKFFPDIRRTSVQLYDEVSTICTSFNQSQESRPLKCDIIG